MSALRMIGMLVVCAGLGYAVWLDNTSGESDDAPRARQSHDRTTRPLVIQTAPADVARPAGGACNHRRWSDSTLTPSSIWRKPESGGRASRSSKLPQATGEARTRKMGQPASRRSAEHSRRRSSRPSPLSSVDIGILSDTVEQPLFAVSRQLATPETLIRRNRAARPRRRSNCWASSSTVLARPPSCDATQTGAKFSVEPGDTLSGWKVARNEPSSVVLERPGKASSKRSNLGTEEPQIPVALAHRVALENYFIPSPKLNGWRAEFR